MGNVRLLDGRGTLKAYPPTSLSREVMWILAGPHIYRIFFGSVGEHGCVTTARGRI